MIKPGFVQNWPTPNVMEAAYIFATSAADCFNFSGNKKTGLILLISANTGIGSFL